jgi:hypothetical protein
MFTFVSAILLGTGIYFNATNYADGYWVWYFVTAGLFAVASAIDRLNIEIDTTEEDKKDGE